ncbi:MAG: polysaccharide biosynthesis tyrosine autokinase [Muribaculaceae bacterium]|nr:polysaccharide biosynthesis tyrosine autokinase [Muribaculaceae bacterium]
MAENRETNKFTTISQIKISDVIYATLRRWPWIFVSLAVFVGGAYFYLLRTPPTYTRTASVLIKDDAKNSSSQLDALTSVGLYPGNTNLNDELNKFQSPDMMIEVVKRLNLDMNYLTDGPYHKVTLYGSSLPLTVRFPSLTESERASVVVNVDKKGMVKISDLVKGAEELSAPKEAFPIGDSIPTELGYVVVNPTPYYKKGQEYRVYVSRAPLASASASYLGSLGISGKNDKGNTINLSITDRSTERAEDVLNTLISVYNEKWVENRNQISVATSKFINERLAVIESELGNVDHDISSYQSEHLIPDVQQAASMYMSENQAAASQILELNNRLQMTRYMRNYLSEASNKKSVLPVNSGIENSNIESQISEYNALMLQRNSYVNNSSESHPKVVELDTQLASLRSAILSAVDNQIVALRTQIGNVQSSKNRTTSRIAASPNQAKYLLSVERQQKVKESLYLFLLQKREENELSQAFTAYNTEIITSPNGSSAPTAPVRNKILLIAFLAGLALPFGVTYMLEMNNNKVRGRKDIEDLSVPFIGEIPTLKPKKGEKKSDTEFVVRPGRRDVVNEAFRVIRTNIGFMSASDTGCSVVMVTSFNPGSGKTFIAMNVAMSMAIRGKSVLVVDGDMRRASSSAYVGSPKEGLSNYLVGQIQDINSVIVQTPECKDLYVLPVGSLPPNPTELLESERFSQLITRLRGMFDYVIIDCPPIEMMADAHIVESVVDRTIFVVRAGLLDRSMLSELERLYTEKKFKNIGMVLNATPAQGSRYGYKYGYGYGYGYGNYRHYEPKDED